MEIRSSDFCTVGEKPRVFLLRNILLFAVALYFFSVEEDEADCAVLPGFFDNFFYKRNILDFYFRVSFFTLIQKKIVNF